MTRFRNRHLARTLPVVAAMALSFGAAPVLAQPVAATFDELITRLASTDFTSRQDAEVQLRASSEATLPRLEAELKKPELSREQRHRLLLIARDRYMSSDRAAMGVSFYTRSVLRDRVTIELPHAPFPSERLLKPGDVVIEADGQIIRGPGAQQRLRAMIISKDPGDQVRLVIRRGAEKLTFDVPLGRFADLRQGIMSDLDLVRSWQTRSATYSAEAPALVLTDLLPGDKWGLVREQNGRQISPKLVAANMLPARGDLFGGGEPRGSALTFDDTRNMVLQRGFVINGAADPRMIPPALLRQMLEPTGGPSMKIWQEVKVLDSNCRKYAAELEALSAGVAEPAEPGTPPERVREFVEQQRKDKQAALDLLTLQLAAMQAELAEHPDEGPPPEEAEFMPQPAPAPSR